MPERYAELLPIHAKMYGGKYKTPVRTKDVQRSDGKSSLESGECKNRSRNENSACKSADHGQEQKSIQKETDAARGIISAFSQCFIPGTVQPGMQQKGGGQKKPQPFMSDAAGMMSGHKQQKQKQHEDIGQYSCPYNHFFVPFFCSMGCAPWRKEMESRHRAAAAEAGSGADFSLICRIGRLYLRIKIRSWQKIA